MKKTLIRVMLGFAASSFAACGVAPEETQQAPEAVAVEQEACSIGCHGALAYIDGVPAISNGANQGTVYSCGGSGTYGSQYQCVEFARRYWKIAQGNDLPWLGASGYASQLCDQAQTNFTVYWAGSGYRPVHGDLFVIGGNPGHVAVVDSADGTYAYTVEQNGSCTGRKTYALSQARCFLRPW
jgi:hypothetical protein